MATSYQPLSQGGGTATQAPSGSFPTGVDVTGLGVSSAEFSKKIPTGSIQVPDFAAQRGGLAGPGNGPKTGTAMATAQGAVTFGQALQGLTNMDPSAIEQLQQDMYQAKLYGKSYYKKGADDPVSGLLDAPTLSAYIKTLRLAYNAQQPVTNILNAQKAHHPELRGVTSPDDLSPSFRITNPADLLSAATTSAQKLGRKPTQQEVNALTQRYHAQEMASQSATFAANPGSVTPDPANLSSFADQFYQQQNPQEYAMHNALGIADQIMQTIQSYGTTAPHGSI